MKKSTLLLISVVMLLLLNIATLSFLFLQSQRSVKAERGPKNIIIDRLDFNNEQQKEFKEAIEWHRKKISDIDRKIRKAKFDLYSQLKNENTKTKDSIIANIADYHIEIENVHFKHFLKIKSICNDTQKDKFDKLIVDLPRLFSPHHKKHEPHHHRKY